MNGRPPVTEIVLNPTPPAGKALAVTTMEACDVVLSAEANASEAAEPTYSRRKRPGAVMPPPLGEWLTRRTMDSPDRP